MSRIVLLFLAFGLFGASLLASGALAQRAPLFDDATETREALRAALAERAEAEERSARFEQEAQVAEDAAGRAAREAAALAARIQQAEAGIAAAEARMGLVASERRRLREELGQEQQPVVRLTAALQQFARRPLALAILRPGDVRDIVYLRAVMASAVPEIEARTEGLRGRIARARQLQDEAQQAARVLRAEEDSLAMRREELAMVETRQRLAARKAGGSASREAERALALAEDTRDFEALVDELDRAAQLRERLAGLSGPRLRPERPGEARLVDTATPEPVANAPAAPAPYMLPVSGRTVTGFGAPIAAGLSQGLTLAPRASAQVVAPAAGRVAFAGPYRGYGQIVIIEHSGGWTSLVTGLARSDVAVGEELIGGAPIGVAGPARPTVSLELRRDGEPVNPLAYIG